MAILKNTIIAASVLASYALAVPLAAMNKRDMVWQTYTETAWVTQNVLATVWVDDDGKPVKTDMPSGAALTVQPAASSSTTSAVASTTPAPAAPVAPSAPSAPPAAPVAPSSSTSSSAAYSPAGFASVPSPSPTPVVAANVPAAPPAAPASSSSPVAPSSRSSGVCQGQGSGCSGDITHYDGGLGACGWNVNTNSDMQIALPWALMGTQSNGNPYCGRSLTIIGTSGNPVQATVGDKCMGCTGDSIDLTNVLFAAVAPNGDGRVSNIQWYFN